MRRVVLFILYIFRITLTFSVNGVVKILLEMDKRGLGGWQQYEGIVKEISYDDIQPSQ